MPTEPDTTCPDYADLEELLSGHLPGDRQRDLGAHLASCPYCTRAFGPLLERDSLANLCRGASAEETPVSPELMKALLELDSDAQRQLRMALEELRPILAPPQSPEEIGRLGAYAIFHVLGSGATGIVCLAQEVPSDRPVALKILRPHWANDPASRRRFLEEARAASSIDSEFTVAIHAVGEANGTAFIAQEYLGGQTLAARLEERSLSIPEAIRIAREIALGLAAAHERGLIHRDIKPENIWLKTPGDRVVILDFGIARPLESEVFLTRPGAVFGTPAYMSPEQANGRIVEARTDLFSLGVLLYRMLAGRLPFGGTTILTQLNALANESPKPVSRFNPAVPRGLETLVHRLIEKKIHRRPDSARAVAVELEGFDAERPRTRSPIRWLIAGSVAIAFSFAVVVPIAKWKPATPKSEATPEPIPRPSALKYEGGHVDLGDLNLNSFPAVTLELFVRPDNTLSMKTRKVFSIFGVKGWCMVGLGSFEHEGEWNFKVDASKRGALITAPPVIDGSRYHVAGVRDGTILKLFVNGKKIAEGAVQGELRGNETNAALGSEVFRGEIDKARISTCARYSEDFVPTESWAVDEQTFALFEFADGSGTSLTDSSGRGHHGKLGGPVRWVLRWDTLVK